MSITLVGYPDHERAARRAYWAATEAARWTLEEFALRDTTDLEHEYAQLTADHRQPARRLQRVKGNGR